MWICVIVSGAAVTVSDPEVCVLNLLQQYMWGRMFSGNTQLRWKLPAEHLKIVDFNLISTGVNNDSLYLLSICNRR